MPRMGDKTKFKAMTLSSDEGGCTVSVLHSPGRMSEGDSADESLANMKEAVELYLDPDNRNRMEGSIIREA